MHIFFIAPQVKKTNIPEEYTAIMMAAKKLGYSLKTDFIYQSENKLSEEELNITLQKRYKAMVNELKQSDLLVAEGTFINAEISRLISIALQSHIPTLVLYHKNNPEAFVFEPSRLLSLQKYSIKTIQKILGDYLKHAKRKKLLYRFNLMLSKEMNAFVMDKSNDHNISKADYIRKLILTAMDKKDTSS